MLFSKKTKIITIFALTGSIIGSTLILPESKTIFAAETQNQYKFLTEDTLKQTVSKAIPSYIDTQGLSFLRNNKGGSIPQNILKIWQSNPTIMSHFKKILSSPEVMTLANSQIENAESTLGSLRAIGTPQLLHVGKNELVNHDSQQTRNLTSAPFSKAFTSSSTVTVTNGVNLGYKVGTKVGLKIGETGVDITTEFSHNINWSKTNSTVNSTTETYTAPSQTIAVPPRSRAIVNYILKKQAYTGDIQLKGNLTGAMNFRDPYIVYGPDIPPSQKILATDSLYNILKKSKVQLPSGLSLDTVNKKIKFNGKALFTADVGLDYFVEVKIESLDNPGKIIETFEKKIATTKNN